MDLHARMPMDVPTHLLYQHTFCVHIVHTWMYQHTCCSAHGAHGVVQGGTLEQVSTTDGRLKLTCAVESQPSSQVVDELEEPIYICCVVWRVPLIRVAVIMSMPMQDHAGINFSSPDHVANPCGSTSQAATAIMITFSFALFSVA